MTLQYKFSAEGRYFLYDYITNEILEIHPEIFKILPSWKYQNGLCKDLDLAVKAKMISLQPPILVNPTKHPDFKNVFNNIASSLTLCVTEQCNLRCEYCLYSSKSDCWHSHSSKNMSLKTAVKALHCFKKYNDGSDYPVICFYGGEPLLQFDLIKKIVKEAKKIFFDKNLSFNITTNATMINSEIAVFFAENNFNPLVSIDGPKKLHDRYRRTINGEGSFDKALRGLNLLLKSFPSNLIENIRVNFVLSPPFDFEALNTFFKEELPVKVSNCSTSLVNDLGTDFIKNHPYSDNDVKQIDLLRAKAEECFITGKWDDYPVAWLFLQNNFRKIAHRNRINISKGKYIPTGQCVSGSHKLHTDVDGNFHMCERIQEKCFIGDVDNGLNVKKITSILNKYYKKATKKCNKCYALRFCKICLANSLINGVIDIKEATCSAIIDEFEKDLISYVKILSKNPDAFKDSLGFVQTKSYAKLLEY